MSIGLKPLRDSVVAVQDEAQTQTASGLYLPNASKERPAVAKVLAVGDDTKEVKIGDKVVYKKYNTTEVKTDGQDYLIIKEEDILAIIN